MIKKKLLKKKEPTLLNYIIKDVISSNMFPVVINTLIFIVLCVLSIFKLNYGPLAIIMILWTLCMSYIIVDIVIWKYKDFDNYDRDFVYCILLAVFASSMVLYGLGGTASFVDIHKTIKTETYIPIDIIKTNTKIIIVGKTHTLESTNIADLMNENIKICKDENINAWNIRISDKWYLCGK